MNWASKPIGTSDFWRPLVAARSRQLRRCTCAGTPFGSEAAVAEMERRAGRELRHKLPDRLRRPICVAAVIRCFTAHRLYRIETLPNQGPEMTSASSRESRTRVSPSPGSRLR